MDDDARTPYLLDVITRTKLLCNNNEELADILGRPSILSGNGVRHGNPALERQDYTTFERRAEVLTDGEISKGKYCHQLADLIDDYVAVSNSYNERLLKLKNYNPHYFSARTANEERADILAGIISNSLKDNNFMNPLLDFLRLSPADPRGYVDNYYAAIGILLLLKGLKPGNDKNRIRGNRNADELSGAYTTASTLMHRLYEKSFAPGIIFNGKDGYQNLQPKDNVCRLSLIFRFKQALDKYLLRIRPDAFEVDYKFPFYESKLIIPDHTLFRDLADDKKNHFFKIKQYLDNRYHLYDCHYEVRDSESHIRNELFQVTLYRTGMARVASIRYQYYLITNEDSASKYESLYSYDYDERTETLSLRRECYHQDTQVRFPPEIHLKVITDGHYECIHNCINSLMDPPKDNEYAEGKGVFSISQFGGIDVDDRDGKYITLLVNNTPFCAVRCIEENHLDKLSPPFDRIVYIYKVRLEGKKERMFLYIENGDRYSFEITDEESMKKYGVTPNSSFH